MLTAKWQFYYENRSLTAFQSDCSCLFATIANFHTVGLEGLPIDGAVSEVEVHSW